MQQGLWNKGLGSMHEKKKKVTNTRDNIKLQQTLDRPLGEGNGTELHINEVAFSIISTSLQSETSRANYTDQ